MHPDDGAFESFVMGTLDDDDAFVRHVAACDACAAKLRGEAELELRLLDVPRTRVPARRRWVAAGVLAAAAGMMLVASAKHHRGAAATIMADGARRGHGLDLAIRVKQDSTPPMPGLAETIASIEPPLASCIERRTQGITEPVDGEIEIDFAVDPSGALMDEPRVTEDIIRWNGNAPPPLLDVAERCGRMGYGTARFRGNGQTAKLALVVTFSRAP